jgi:hypothetical protein
VACRKRRRMAACGGPAATPCIRRSPRAPLRRRSSAGQRLPQHLPPLLLPCPPPRSRALKSECGAYAELARLCGQGQSAAELAAFAQGKAAEFEAVRARACMKPGCRLSLPCRPPPSAHPGASWRACPAARGRGCRAGHCLPPLSAALPPAPPPPQPTPAPQPTGRGSALPPRQDGNTGLVRLAIEGAARRQVQKLTQTYLTLR